MVAEQVPVDPHLRDVFGGEALGLALSGGEDYQLLFTAPDEAMERVRQGLSFTVVGGVTAQQGQLEVVDASGQPLTYQEKGWQHFGRR